MSQSYQPKRHHTSLQSAAKIENVHIISSFMAFLGAAVSEIGVYRAVLGKNVSYEKNETTILLLELIL